MEKYNKKAQQEIVGLLVIIVLLVFSVLFFLMLSYNNPSLPSIKEVSKATSILNILSKVTLCQDISLEEVVKLCSQSQNACSKNACDLAKEETEEMLRLLLKPKETFKVIALYNDKEILSLGDCKGDAIATSRKIPTQTSIIDLKLSVCKE